MLCAWSLSCVRLSPTPWTAIHQAPLSIGILQVRILSGLPCPLVYLPNPGIKPRSPVLQVDSLPAEPPEKPKNAGVGSLSLLQWIFPTQELNWGLLHCRQFLNQLSYQGSLLRKTQGLFNFLSFMLNLYPQGDLFSFLGTKISK